MREMSRMHNTYCRNDIVIHNTKWIKVMNNKNKNKIKLNF